MLNETITVSLLLKEGVIRKAFAVLFRVATLFTTQSQGATTIIATHAALRLDLPGRYDYDPMLYEQEQQRIFSQFWFCVGHTSALAEAGTYQTITFGGESVLVVCHSDGSLRTYLNVYRHRGARLCTQEMGRLKVSIQCRYHA